jgi:hypothetical protein
MAATLGTVHLMPDCLRHWLMTALHPASTRPGPAARIFETGRAPRPGLRMEAIRSFAALLNAYDPAHEIFLGLFPQQGPRTVPYLYSPDELRSAYPRFTDGPPGSLLGARPGARMNRSPVIGRGSG